VAVATHLADKSALARLRLAPVAARLGPMIEAGLVGTCGIIELEVRFSSQSHDQYEAVRADRSRGYEWFPMGDEIWGRALDVQRELSRQGHLRGVRFPDLLIAATAERHGLTVIHYDHDYDLIAAVTGQPVEWVVAAGSVP
jgi:predicted nucleic acid-binding protein